MRVRAAVVALAVVATAGAGTALAAGGLPRAARASRYPVAGQSAAQAAAPQLSSARSVAQPRRLTVAAVPTVAQATVAPLRTLRTPDLLVSVPRSLTTSQVAALHALPGLRGMTLLDLGTVHLGAGKGVRIAGVDPGQFRQFTPRETAASNPLWAAVARGEIAATYGLVRSRHLTLGNAVVVSGPRPVGQRIGAIAVFGVPGVEIIASRTVAHALGAVAANAVVVQAPGRGIAALSAAVRAAVGPAAKVQVLRPLTVTPYRGKPRTYRDLYIQSARYCPGLRWQVLAAIGQVESGHGRNVGRSSAGALGPMQFLPSTWAYSGVDGDGDGKADIMNPLDAVPSAALYLCRAGASQGDQGLYDAVFSYNHADWYVKLVLDLAARYR